MHLRKLTKMQTANDGTRSLVGSIMVPQVITALRKWTKAAADLNAVLIGGLALSFYVKPRTTQDVDFLVPAPADIPDEVAGFERVSASKFRCNETDVEVDIHTSLAIKIPANVVATIFGTAARSNRVRIASVSGLVALKLFRLQMRDQADIVDLLKAGIVSLDDFALSRDQLRAYDGLVEQAKREMELEAS